jgi:dsRNA-specific ribonuclease
VKDSIVSNSRLCRAAIDRGLDEFVLTKSFTGSKWRPIYVEPLLEEREGGTRKLPSKMIADVVESLIGAGWPTSNIVVNCQSVLTGGRLAQS